MGCDGNQDRVVECLDADGACRWEDRTRCRDEDPLLANIGCGRGACIPCTASAQLSNGAWEDGRTGEVDYHGDLSISFGDHLSVRCAGYTWQTDPADGTHDRRSYSFKRLDGESGERRMWLARASCGNHQGGTFRARLVCSCRASQTEEANLAQWASDGGWPDDLTLDEDLGQITCAE